MGKIKKSAEVIFILALLFSASYGISTFFINKHEASQPQISHPDQSAQVVTPDALLAAINAERSKASVAPLRLDTRLNGSAQRKVDEINSDTTPNDNKHVNDSGQHGYTYVFEAVNPGECKRAGENVVFDLKPYKDDKLNQAVDSWMGSERHRAAILNPAYSLTGFGISEDVLVEHFCQV